MLAFARCVRDKGSLVITDQCTSDIDLPWLANSTYRMHRFRSSAFAIKGLTSDILVGTLCVVRQSTHYL